MLEELPNSGQLDSGIPGDGALPPHRHSLGDMGQDRYEKVNILTANGTKDGIPKKAAIPRPFAKTGDGVSSYGDPGVPNAVIPDPGPPVSRLRSVAGIRKAADLAGIGHFSPPLGGGRVKPYGP